MKPKAFKSVIISILISSKSGSVVGGSLTVNDFVASFPSNKTSIS